jgi:hypothetical protein
MVQRVPLGAGVEIRILQECSKLATHLSRVSRDLANDVALDSNVVARAIERHTHALPDSIGGDDPGKADLTRVARGHDLTGAALADAPLGRTRGVDDPLEFTATGET